MQEVILYDVSLAFGITWGDLVAPTDRATGALLDAKQVAAYLLWRYTHIEGEKIAHMLGYRGKQNILYAKKKVSEIMEGDKAFKERVETLIQGILRS